MDTIFAQATAPGKAGVAIVRLSGPKAWVAIETMCSGLPEPRVVGLRELHGRDGLLDTALVVVFEDGASFTGENVAELHLHGSSAVVSAVLSELSSLEGLRHAEPGEFTRRALENGCLDLAQVEGLADLIDAETEAQRRQAIRVLSGELGEKAEGWRQGLIRAAALIEASIDFADEDVPIDVTPEVDDILRRVLNELESEIDGVGFAERVRTGFEVAIVGAPNVGKSTLLNALAGREAAITSEIAGTTRDVIEVRMDLGGLPVTILDTAGLRDTDDPVESIGVEKAQARAKSADLRIFLVDVGGSPAFEPIARDIVVASKADLIGESSEGVSGRTGQGLPKLIEMIQSRISELAGQSGIATRERHRFAMSSASGSLRDALVNLESGEVYELVAEDIRSAIRSLDSLIGRVDVEMLLDDIFSSFCIGK